MVNETESLIDRNSESQIKTKKRNSIGIRSAHTYSKNPFMEGVLTNIQSKKKFYNVTSKPAMAIDPGTGEVLGTVEHKVVRMVDDAQFIKLFSDGVAGVYDLGRSGIRVFKYLFNVVQKHPNVDRIYLYFMDAIEEPWKISKPTFFRGMAELLEKNFIARSQNPNMFFLNPAMIWNGNRFRFIQEFVRGMDPKDVKDININLSRLF